MIDEKKLITDIQGLLVILTSIDGRNHQDELINSYNEALFDVLKTIEEQPKIGNSLDFKHFKLHADSTLKNMTKDELISYIHMLHHNWSYADTRCCNTIEMNYKLEKALDKACALLANGGVVQCKDCFKNPKCTTLEIVNNCYFEEK